MNRNPANGRPVPDGPHLTAEERFLRHKRELHQQLIAGMDLSAIGTLNEEELRVEVRRAAEELCRHSSDLLSLSERERLVNEVLDETFGLGPLEPLMRDSGISDILMLQSIKCFYYNGLGDGSRHLTLVWH
jgi:pilus assembly protein CpaF